MNADNFLYTEYYFNQAIKLIVYCYNQIKNDKKIKPYSRREIQKIIKKVKGSDIAHNEIEDYLRNDLVNNYLKKNRFQFDLEFCSIQAGAEVSKKNVTIGIVDIQFNHYSSSFLHEQTYIFECKILNKYKNYLRGYITEGMNRFITRKYYAESNVPFAGMIGFVTVDLIRKPNGLASLDQISSNLAQLIKSSEIMNLIKGLELYPLHDDNYEEISNFTFSYLSKHRRQGDDCILKIHHLLFDYYDILNS